MPRTWTIRASWASSTSAMAACLPSFILLLLRSYYPLGVAWCLAKGYSPKCLEGEFSEVGAQDVTLWRPGLRILATRRRRHQLAEAPRRRRADLALCLCEGGVRSRRPTPARASRRVLRRACWRARR